MARKDTTLRQFLEGPTARHIRVTEHLLPLLSKYTVQEMLEFVQNPGDAVEAASLTFVKQMRSGGVKPDVETPAANAERAKD